MGKGVNQAWGLGTSIRILSVFGMKFDIHLIIHPGPIQILIPHHQTFVLPTGNQGAVRGGKKNENSTSMCVADDVPHAISRRCNKENIPTLDVSWINRKENSSSFSFRNLNGKNNSVKLKKLNFEKLKNGKIPWRIKNSSEKILFLN